jgi:carboxyl-terminal processing protease
MHRHELEKFQTAREINEYLLKQDLLTEFIQYAREKGVQPVPSEIDESKTILETMIRAYIARNIIDNEGFYPIIKEIDKALEEAIDTLSKI